ncbi:MAG: flagellar type III secretion system pore protein FliP [Treponema sp.]|uniref:flagellar type III secretion system pore protein FliP n=1 Tax=Treponema sp. TaxID=166 RepID=UPI00298E8CC1|nr:flagellar type III secretion system pore protein FliP [Treponema sp.]MCQ2600005.1 flagellar type III secretion system pore protein FliP [Treponema sp.]
MKNKALKIILFSLIAFSCVVFNTYAQSNNFPSGSTTGTMEMNRNTAPVQVPNIDINIRQPQSGQEVAFSVRLLVILTLLTLAPTMLLLLTCFLRFSIVLDFIKRALSLQQVPPTAILNGIAFFMTLFVMWPTFSQIYTNAYKPMADGQINLETAYREAEKPVRIFMADQMDGDYEYITLFMSMANMERPNTLADVPTHVLIPAYILHELKIAFMIGIYLYIPFIIIDMVVASILMSMGMMMLPPVQISMPFKLILFVLVDGWGLLIQSLFNSVL